MTSQYRATTAASSAETVAMPRPQAQSPSAVRKFLKIFGGLLVDVGLPMAAYYGLRSYGFSEHVSLLAGAGVAGVRLLFVAFRARKLEPFAGFMLVTYLLALPLLLISGDDRTLVIKDSLGTGITGLIFLASCFVGKPAMFHAARRFRSAGDNVETWEGLWGSNPGFRRSFTFMTAVWAATLLVEAAVRVGLAFVLPIDVMVALSAVLGIGTIALLLTWTMIYGARRQRRLKQAAAAGRA
ncbi:VC0807 family protein [Saccharopolyspora shandongensis]|uniref:VC0807 family protein n=1 Tax=Saccharopolyspora shandongensis TaxID=418495 RepID=UPI0034304F42